jgi:hypothetical protein
MWVFLSGRLRSWLILAVAVPAGTLAVRTVRKQIEKRSGSTRLTRSLSRVERLGQGSRRKRR